MDSFKNPTPEEICMFLRKCKTLAIVGLSPRPARPSHQVASAMLKFGFQIIPVRPAVSEILGERAYADIVEVERAIDLAVIFRNPTQVDPIIDACIGKNVPVWMQDGVINESAANRAKNAGLFTVMNRCVYRDFSSLC